MNTTMSADATQDKSKISSLQALRALAFLCIFISHCDIGNGVLGGYGVSVFIVLSGFLMYYTYIDRTLPCGPKESFLFSVRKVKKLYPLHIIMILFALVLIFFSIRDSFSSATCLFYSACIVLNGLLLQDWVPSMTVAFSLNGVAWYLSLCLFLYFAFPFLMRQLRNIRSRKQAVLIIAAIFVLQLIIRFLAHCIPDQIWIFNDVPTWITYICPVFRLGDFAAGCCMGYLYLNTPHKLSTSLYTLLELCTAAAACFVLYMAYRSVALFGNISFSSLYVPVSCLVVYVFALKKGIFSRLLTNRVFIYLGNISAYAFLIHQVVIRYFAAVSGIISAGDPNIFIKLAVCLFVTVSLAQIYSLFKKHHGLRKQKV